MAQGWEDMERYAQAKKEWLGRFLKREHGIPPHDVYRRVSDRPRFAVLPLSPNAQIVGQVEP